MIPFSDGREQSVELAAREDVAQGGAAIMLVHLSAEQKAGSRALLCLQDSWAVPFPK